MRQIKHSVEVHPRTSPLGTWRIPRTKPYILCGDEQALAAALPENLKLIPLKFAPQT
jgi:hypothetical protein